MFNTHWRNQSLQVAIRNIRNTRAARNTESRHPVVSFVLFNMEASLTVTEDKIVQSCSTPNLFRLGDISCWISRVNMSREGSC